MFQALKSLTSIEYFYIICITIGGILFILRTLLFFIGGGADSHIEGDLGGNMDLDAHGDMDMHADDISDAGMKLVTVQGLTGFFLMFGLVGLAMVKFEIKDFWTAVGGLIAGLGTMLIIAKIVLEMQKLQSSGTMRMENALGKEGTVYLSIPEEGPGKVNIVIQGGLRELEAVSANHERIPTGESVRVVKILSNRILVVEKVNK
jgi:membrane protein implicated in regulation of membrane protease activity